MAADLEEGPLLVQSPVRSGWGQRALGAGLLLVAVAELLVAAPLLARWGRPAAAEWPRFLVIGDWGRDGDYNQSATADAMAARAAALRPHFVVSTGDNMYDSGLRNAQDPQFASSFSDIYHQPALQVPWHAVLGNHDYGEVNEGDLPVPDCSSWLDAASSTSNSSGGGGGGGSGSDAEGGEEGSGGREECFYSPLHQLGPALPARDGRWHCERAYSLRLAGGEVEIFFIDTTPMIKQYLDCDWASNRGGLREQSWEAGVRELGGRLARSAARWKLVVGHHPVRTTAREEFSSYGELVEHLEPLIRRYGVQAYFTGHDHVLQHMHSAERGYHQVTSGAGSRTGDEFFSKGDAQLQYAGNGFVSVEMGASSMLVQYYGILTDRPLYSVKIPRS